MAYAGLADAYSVMSSYGFDPNDVIPKAIAAAEKALELDPTLARPHADLGLIKMQHDWDFSGGEAEFRKAIELDPSDATAHQWFAQSLTYIGGRGQEAMDEGNRARQLDPLSAIIAHAQAETYIYAHQFDQAVALYNKVLAENPTLGPAHLGLSAAYLGQHKYQQSIQELGSAAQAVGDKNLADQAAAMDAGFRSGGWANAVQKSIEVSLAQRKTKTGYVPPYGIAQSYADLGDKDRAFEWLNTAYQEHDALLVGLRTDFSFDSLHSDPRFAELVRKVGFPQ